MKTLIITALIGALGFNALGSNEVIIVEKHTQRSEVKNDEKAERELKEKVEVQLFNLEMLWKQFEQVSDNIGLSKGNHKEIDKDYEFFYSHLNSDNKTDNAETEKNIHKLTKEYDRKHLKRAKLEVIQRKDLIQKMEKELMSYSKNFKILKSKNRADLTEMTNPVVLKLENKLVESSEQLRQISFKNIENVASYEQKLKDNSKTTVYVKN